MLVKVKTNTTMFSSKRELISPWHSWTHSSSRYSLATITNCYCVGLGKDNNLHVLTKKWMDLAMKTFFITLFNHHRTKLLSITDSCWICLLYFMAISRSLLVVFVTYNFVLSLRVFWFSLAHKIAFNLPTTNLPSCRTCLFCLLCSLVCA